MTSRTDENGNEIISKVYCKCGCTEYTPLDNRTTDVLTLKCVECGNEVDW